MMSDATSHLDLGHVHGGTQRSHGDHQVDHKGDADGFADGWRHDGREGRGAVPGCCVEREAVVPP